MQKKEVMAIPPNLKKIGYLCHIYMKKEEWKEIYRKRKCFNKVKRILNKYHYSEFDFLRNMQLIDILRFKREFEDFIKEIKNKKGV